MNKRNNDILSKHKNSEFRISDSEFPKEGDLYRVVTTFGRTFELKYGYYEEIDRDGDPDVIYPDFINNPLYTDDGEPFVTMMQDACGGFDGELKRNEDSTCSECRYFNRGEDWFGICLCAENRISDTK